MAQSEDKTYETIESGFHPIKAWTRGVVVDPNAIEQLKSAARLPIVFKWIAAMPDVHVGIGATVGSVIPTKGAIIPAAVGVDIGCGMMAVKTSLTASDLPDGMKDVRTAIERAVPHGRTASGGPNDRGAWKNAPRAAGEAWVDLETRFKNIARKHPSVARGANGIEAKQLGTLGSGNHFIEVCLDEADAVWLMLHSGSRGVGNRIGRYFIEKAKKDMRRLDARLPDADLAYFTEGTEHFDDYVEAVGWAQDYAKTNRDLMMSAVVDGLRKSGTLPPFTAHAGLGSAVNCHHNYVAREEHYGEEVLVTRKGAVRARAGDLGIIPGSMGAKSFIVHGLGNAESFHSCSHGAGRLMSRTQAKHRFTLAEHEEATRGIECRKDAHVIDETPGAYKPIDTVMNAQRDLVEVVHTLKQIVCVKG